MKKMTDSLRSMTGFGSAGAENQLVRINAEVKTLNGRYLDVILRLPRGYSAFEGQLRSLAAKYFERGRCEITVDRQQLSEQSATVRLNEQLFRSYYQACLQAAHSVSLDDDGDLKARIILDVLNRRDLFDVCETTGVEASEEPLLQQAVKGAIEGALAMRVAEGNKLGLDLSKRLCNLKDLKNNIGQLLQGAPADLRSRLSSRLAELAPDVRIEPERLAQEVALLADRVDVTEELVRLESHFGLFEETLTVPGTGRKLEFLLQEIGREFNTVGSKAQNSAVQQLVVEAKAEMEKIREQLQNVE